MEYTGKLIHIGSLETVGANNLPKRTFVLEEISDREYKWWLAVDLLKDKVSLIDWFKLWDTLTVYLNVRANYSENTKKYYNAIQAWRIEWDKTEVRHDSDSDDDMPF